mmetsp:Transcript_23410/g.44055  ORF Transcript_23410/g.44055 Transcript_23410/m.44055 type:complete len:262 (+) Transcript_23410:48-833(+)
MRTWLWLVKNQQKAWLLAFISVWCGTSQEVDMPCTSLACPTGYVHRWDADTTFCTGACNITDAETCCLLRGYASYSWRIVAASSVSTSWDMVSLRFYLADNCSMDSLVATVPGRRSNGAAFSHHHGRGAVAAELFHEPIQLPSSTIDPGAVKWSSGGPCQPGQCFVGFSWESDSTRHPLGDCKPTRGSCTTVGYVQQAGAFRVGCAEVTQSQDPGYFADTLRLQLLDVDGRDSNLTENGVWRTAVEARQVAGGLTRLQQSP